MPEDKTETEHTDTEPAPREDAPEDLPSAGEIVGTLFKESTLWPLLIVFLGTGGAFGAAMLVLALGDQNLFAAAALVLVAGMTVDVCVRSRKSADLRNVAKLLIGFWCAAVLLAGVAVYTGIT